MSERGFLSERAARRIVDVVATHPGVRLTQHIRGPDSGALSIVRNNLLVDVADIIEEEYAPMIRSLKTAYEALESAGADTLYYHRPLNIAKTALGQALGNISEKVKTSERSEQVGRILDI